MVGKRRKRIRDDFYSRPSFLPKTLYIDCHVPECSMQALMGLNNDRAKMKQCVETMSVCATRHLDATKSYTQQPKQTVEKYLRSVSQHIDFMNVYEDAWPALAYARMWLNWSYKARQRRGKYGPCTKTPVGKKSISTKSNENSRTKPEDNKENKMPAGQTSILEDAQPQNSSQTSGTISEPQATPDPTPTTTTLATQTSTRTRSHTLCSHTSHRTPPPNQRQLPPRAGPSARERPLPNSTPGSSRILTSANPVATFLRSLAQPLEHLLPVLCEAGVRDTGSLFGLARLRDRGDWLYVLVVDRKITPLEYKFIADGLDDLLKAKRE
ncbi:hypothetical protein L226DRAFT_188719 [Lentinus tigrinus ALCF2SS1-7]|uniref:Uncharacterized protein n=1 Tax=Lentinus tigrinus ALCF2SS1-6 TaxID=1328759 RepID=A0A5C2SQH8_9APHY|nr:hypothetical protein L227DRAFT_132365 [Lentinus tigrinus ALCF2SS1-6]RPD80028.1 hypothetical protein L226DRAFT_188719 [Lentinus tigrinus ALCF2SS1-7]